MKSLGFTEFLNKHPEAIANVPMEDIPQGFQISRIHLPYLIHRKDLSENIADQLLNYISCYQHCPLSTVDVTRLVENHPFLRQRYLGTLLSHGIIKDFTEDEVVTFIKEFHMAPYHKGLLQGASDRVYRAFLDKVIAKKGTDYDFRDYDYFPNNLAEEYFNKLPQLIKYMESPSISQIKYAFSRIPSSMYRVLKPSAWNSLDKKVQYSLLKNHIYKNVSWLFNFFRAFPPTYEMLNHCIDNSSFVAVVYYDIAIKNKLLDKTMHDKIFLSCDIPLYSNTFDYITEELLLKSIEKHGALDCKKQIQFCDDITCVEKLVKKYPDIFNSLDERIEQEYQSLCKKYLKPQ